MHVVPPCLSSPLAHHSPQVVAPSTRVITLLMALPTDVQIEIAGHLAVTSDHPMDDLYSLWVTCSSMCHICGDPAIGRHLASDWFRRGRTGADPVDYYALFASQNQVDNLEACFLIWIQTVFMEN
jgi:hypothetical protein